MKKIIAIVRAVHRVDTTKVNIKNSKPVSMPLIAYFKLNANQSPSTLNEKELMKNIPYALVVKNLMYSMLCIRPNLVHALDMVSRFLANYNDLNL